MSLPGLFPRCAGGNGDTHGFIDSRAAAMGSSRWRTSKAFQSLWKWKMKFDSTMEILAPRNRVVELFRNPDHLAKWQDGFQGVEQVSGTPGETGAQKKMFYSQGGRKMELLETITSNRLPDEFSALYQHAAMENTMTCRFTEINDGAATRFECEVEYTKFNGIIPKLMGLFFRGMFRKQAQKWFDQFKAHAEQGDQP